jgi:hypothetical protein
MKLKLVLFLVKTGIYIFINISKRFIYRYTLIENRPKYNSLIITYIFHCTKMKNLVIMLKKCVW